MSDRMDRLKAKFAQQPIREMLINIGGTFIDLYREQEFRKLQLALEPEFWCDEGWAYKGGCNNYLVEQGNGPGVHSTGSCDFDFMDGVLTLNIHDDAGVTIETEMEKIS